MGHEQPAEPGNGLGAYDGTVRLIGDQPYLLIEFASTGQDVELRMSCDRISCDGTPEGFARALEAIIEEIRS